MAHQFGIDSDADARWLTLTRSVEAGARWLDQVLQRCATPEARAELCGRRRACLEALRHCSERWTIRPPLTSRRGFFQSPGLSVVTTRDPEYPPLLAQCSDRPPFLFFRGAPRHLTARTVSIVGTRKPSVEGRRAANEFAAAAARSGLSVVSGLALGVDGIAHDAALAAGGCTIAVLPSGLDRIYPARHQQLAERVARGGALVSEFPLGTPPRKHHFHRRNRTLSGFSMSTLVVEGGRPSGTLLTASAAADQGRDVMVLPWSIYHREGAGCRYLLEDGALLVQSTEAMCAHLGVAAASNGPASSPSGPMAVERRDEGNLSPDQRTLLSLLGSGTHSAEVLALQLEWDLDHCLACLSALEVAARIQRAPGGYSAMI